MEKAKDKLKVSVIIPNYNNGKYLEECLNSALNQTLKDIEIIIIDDCSTDNSMEVLQSFQAKYPEKIKVIKNQENSGAGLSRNSGLDIATGEFIKFLDADDTLDEDALESMYNIAKQHNVKMVIGQIKALGEKKEDVIGKTGKVDISTQREDLVFGTAGIGEELFARELFDGIRFPKLKWEDFATIPAIKVLANDIYYMNKFVYNYRVHETSTTSTDMSKKNPKIFDIVYCLQNLRKMIPEEYKEELDALEIIHYGARMREIASWQDCSEENKKILINSMQRIIELEVPNYKDNKYMKQPENTKKLSDYLVSDMMNQDISNEEIYMQLRELEYNTKISELIDKLQKCEDFEQIEKHNKDELETEIIKDAFSATEEVIASEQWIEKDKKRLVTLLYQILSRLVPNLDNKILKVRQAQNKFNRADDNRHSGLTKKLNSYLEQGYIASDSVEEILENVQEILISEEFLKYSMARTTQFALQDETITLDDIRSLEQYEKIKLRENEVKGVEMND